MLNRILLVTLLLLLFLVGCKNRVAPDGEGLDSISERGESLALPNVQALPVEEPQSAGSDEAEPLLDRASEARVVDLVNQARREEGLPPLQEHLLLAEMAEGHSLQMAAEGFFSHQDPGVGGVEERALLVGYAYTSLGENIAAGSATPEEVVAAWLASPGHRANILGADFSQIGVGYVSVSESIYQHYWTMVVGKP